VDRRVRRESPVKPAGHTLRNMTNPLIPSGPAVEAHGLVKNFADMRAVDGVDLTVHRGEVFGVLGPNGAGKTTMLKMLATLLPIDAGEARIFGTDVRDHPHLVRQLLCEGLFLALLGGALGLFISLWSNALLIGSLDGLFGSMNFSIVVQLRPDMTVLAVTFLICLIATLLFSLGPALKASRMNPIEALRYE